MQSIVCQLIEPNVKRIMNMQFIITRMLTVMFLLIAFTWLSSCKKDDDPVDPRDLQIKRLTATWNIESVTNDNIDVSGQFTGMTLTIDGLNFTTQNGGNPWPTHGTYTFKDNDLNTIIRSDGVEIALVEVTANTLILSFNYASINGRVQGITGGFIFSMIKQ